MKHFILYTLLILLFAWDLGAVAQTEKVLKPVRIVPPNPGMAPKKNDRSDEQLAAQYFRNREFDKAVVLYKKLYEEKNASIYYTYYLYCLLELEEYKVAEKLVKEQIQMNPERLKYKVDLGHVYNEAGDPGKARKQFDQALKRIPANRNAIQELANAFLQRGQTDYAVEVYDKGRKLMDYPFYLELGNLYRTTRNYSSMVEAYLDCVDYDFYTMSTVQARLQSVLSDDPDGDIAEYLRVSLLRRVQKDAEKVYFSEMLLWLSIQNEDFDMALIQAKSIDRRMDEPGDRLMELAEIARSNNQYDVAMDAYKYVLKKGTQSLYYLDAKIGLLYTHYLKTVDSYEHDPGDLEELEQEYLNTLDEFGRNASTIVIMQYLGHLQAFYLDKPEEAIATLTQAIQMPNTPPRNVSRCKIELADVLLLSGDVWEAKLLYAQVEKTFKHDVLGYEAKFKNARLSFYIGEYDWARAQLDVLKAATSKLIANDALRLSVLISDNIQGDSSTQALSMYGEADLLLYRNKDDEALAVLDSILAPGGYHPIYDEVLLKKAEIRIRQQNFPLAAELLEELLETYTYEITADNALYMLAEINEKQLEDPERAQELYKRLINEYPASLYAVEARKRFRILRGDFDKEELTEEEKLLFNLENN